MGIIRNKKAFFAFLLPGLLFYILAVFYPIEESIRMSFMKWNGIGDKEFVGLSNYIDMFHDKVFFTSFFNNLIYLVIVVVMQLSIGLLFCNPAYIYDEAGDPGQDAVLRALHHYDGSHCPAFQKRLFYRAHGTSEPVSAGHRT